MPIRRVNLPPEISGELWLGPMPGRYEALADDLAAIRARDISRIICLTTPAEIAVKSPDYAKAQPDLEISVTSFPIGNFSVPEDEVGLRDLAEQAARDLAEGRNLFLHCAAGIGRTGTVAVCVLLALGFARAQAAAIIAAAGSGPDTDSQKRLVDRFAGRPRRGAIGSGQ